MADCARRDREVMVDSPARARRVSRESTLGDESRTPLEDSPPQSPPRIGVGPHSHPLSASRPYASPSTIGQYDFAWDESPAPRSSPRLAFNNRSLLRRYDGVEGFPKTWKNVDAASSKRKRRPVSAEDVGRTRPRVLTPEPDDAPPQTKLDFSDAMSDDDDDAETREPHRSLVELLWGLSEYDSRRAPG